MRAASIAAIGGLMATLLAPLPALEFATLAGTWTVDAEASWAALLAARPALATQTGDVLAAERARQIDRSRRTGFVIAPTAITVVMQRGDGTEHREAAALADIASTGDRTATATATPERPGKSPMQVDAALAADGALTLRFAKLGQVEVAVLRRAPTTPPAPAAP